MVGYLHNKQENIDQKSGKDRCPYPYTLSLSHKIFFCARNFHKKFSVLTCFCVFVANSQKCIFLKIKLRQEHCQNEVKGHLMDIKTTSRLTFWS